MSLEILTVQEARQAIRLDKRWKASVTEAHSIPAYEDANAKVRLYETIADATFWLDSRIRAYKEMGWTQDYGTKNRGTLKFTKDEAVAVLVLDRVPKKEKKRPERAAEEPQLTLLQGGTK